ncbi:alpha,alpha-trehalose-phosphate synthase [Ameyamaea chiangmaiensis NBRC 103196]|nr:alpha,alpha-trehalose-phosphate synthase [Ameyamaea chiangmaiensis NBRC 103196]
MLHDLLARRGGLWFGWSGDIADNAEHDTAPAIVEEGGVQYATINLTPDEYQGYYANFSNATLWPLIHSLPEQISFDRHSLHVYRTVNARFATTLKDMIRPGDVVWIHDYHLVPLAAALRTRGVQVPIGFFLHTPFPSPDILSTIPEAATFLRQLMQADLVGFQTSHDAQNFVACVERLAGGETAGNNVVTCGGRTVHVGAFPVEIDAPGFARTAAEESDTTAIRRFSESLLGSTLMIGADRMDPTKGIRRRINGYRSFLDKHPEWQERVTFLQVAASSRQDVEIYKSLREELERLSGALNAELAMPAWTPLRFVTRPVARAHLAGIMRTARVGLVTPLRDGMNLVAKEYVAAQDGDDPGVLVLSRYAGAAAQLKDALLVNAFDGDEVADAIHRALSMAREERRRRWEANWHVISSRTPLMWGESFLDALLQARGSGAA